MPLQLVKIDARRDDPRPALAPLRRRLSIHGTMVSAPARQKTLELFGAPLTPDEVVQHICTDVQQRGLTAVLEYCAKLDGATLTAATLRVSRAELAEAHAAADREFLATVRRVIQNIQEFQQAVKVRDVRIDRPGGMRLEQRYLPLHRVGICVPGGAAAYPSTILMTAVPAQAAGVNQIAIMAPPTRFGAYHPLVLATCYELGLHEVYRLGGAHGVAALAYGVDGLPAVDKIVGPGNLFVALAKKRVFGQVAIDSIAGPSEIMVLADHTANPVFVAADLLAQAEHAPGSAILVTWDPPLLDAVAQELERQSAQLDREPFIRPALEEFGALVLVRDADAACGLVDWLAPEHLSLAMDDGQALLDKIHRAGATFVGHFAAVAAGDYAAGPSHVLPTGGTARWAAGLTVNDFLRGGSVLHIPAAGLERIAGDIRRLADVEGLSAHRASIDVRIPLAASLENPQRAAP